MAPTTEQLPATHRTGCAQISPAGYSAPIVCTTGNYRRTIAIRGDTNPPVRDTLARLIFASDCHCTPVEFNSFVGSMRIYKLMKSNEWGVRRCLSGQVFGSMVEIGLERK